MSQETKEMQRRELVFRVLDDLKANGERINADKVARLAKMGKQTVLPHYNEWRFLDDAEKEVDEELPADLVRVLKRALLEWRHTATESQRQFEEEANHEIDKLQSLADQLTNEQLAGKDKIETLTSENKQLNQEKEELRNQLEEYKTAFAVKESDLEAARNQNQERQEEIKQLKVEQTEALSTQEKKLDNQYQGQINHWIKMVDNERRLRSDLESQLKSEKHATLALEKENNDLNLRLENKSSAFLEACDERNTLKQQVAQYEPLDNCIKELTLVLNQPLPKITETVRTLLEQAQQKDKELAFVPALKEKSAQLEKDLENYRVKADSMIKLEIELEKQKGYREALELALEKASRPLENP